MRHMNRSMKKQLSFIATPVHKDMCVLLLVLEGEFTFNL